MNLLNNLRVKYRLMLFPLLLLLILVGIYGVFKRESILADKRLMQNEIIMEVQIKFLRGGQLFYQNNRTQEAYKTFIATIHEMIADLTALHAILITDEGRAQSTEVITGFKDYVGALQDTLEDRVGDISANLEAENSYDTNIEMLDNNIYIMTELIQDNIQYYIYYQTQSMDHLTKQLNERVNTFMIYCAILLGVILFIVIVLTVMIVTGIIKPIQELSQATEKISQGDFSVRVQVDTNDEVAVLADGVNIMTESIERFVSKIKEDERKMRRADLRLLQEQINPHFLYNTLDTIVWLIEGKDPDKAVNMVMSLSEFFRLVLRKGREYITIQEEEMHIKSYLEIQQVRYRDIMDYEIRIAPELYQYKILKLTLQPLVENSLYHGIKYKRAKGNITVTGTMAEGNIHFKVEDDGVGMEEEELANLRREIMKPCKDTGKGFGLANVNERIRMNFGAEYSMTIDSKRGEGTCVEIVIPAVPYEQTEQMEDREGAAISL